MKRYADPQKTLIFIVVAAALMVVVDLFVFGGIRYLEPREQTAIQARHGEEYGPDFHEEYGPPEVERSPTIVKKVDSFLSLQMEEDLPKPKPEPLPPPPAYPVDGARIVIIIDDMGMDRRHSHQAIELPGPLTLAFLPYAPKLNDLAAGARAHKHELLIHMPMQPLSDSANSGPLTLREDMSRAEIRTTLEEAFKTFKGYVGINNHMGSRLTRNKKAMGWVMEELAARNLFFVDSRTIESSVAEETARERGLRHASRDVFLDHEETPEFVERSLRKLENIAARKGYAIAIGHPKQVTIEALRAWLPTLEKKGFKLVPVSAVVTGGSVYGPPEALSSAPPP